MVSNRVGRRGGLFNMVSFSDLGVSSSLVKVLADQGITEPFEVQTESIPDGMLGNDICCRAPTGSVSYTHLTLPTICSV